MPVFLFLLLLLASSALHAQQRIPSQLIGEVPVADTVVQHTRGGGFADLATDGRNFMLVSTSGSHNVMLVDASGKPLLPSSWVFAGEGAKRASVASSGTTFLVVWGTTGGTIAALFDTRGNPVKGPFRIHDDGPGIQPISSGIPVKQPTRRDVVWTGTEYLVLNLSSAFTMPPGIGITYSLVAIRVSNSGDILQNDIATGLSIDSAVVASRNGVTVIATPEHYVVQPGLPVRFSVRVPSDDVAITAGDDGFLIVVTTHAGITARHLDPGGVADGEPFAFAAGAATRADVAWDGSSYVITWADDQGSIRALHVNGRGYRLDPSPIVIAQRAGAANATVAAAGAATLVAWDADSITFAAPLRDRSDVSVVHRIDSGEGAPRTMWSDGAPRVSWNDESGVRARELTARSAVIANGALIAVAARNTGDLYATTAASRLSVTVNGRTTLISKANTQLARAAATSDGFILVWAEVPLPPQSTWTLMAARLRPDGSFVEPAHEIATTPWVQEIAIAVGAENVLVAYRPYEVRGLLLTPSGVTQTDVIATDRDQATSVSIDWDGSDFLVTWIGTPIGHAFIEARRVNSSGRVSGTEPPIYTPQDDFLEGSHVFWTGTEHLIVWGKRTPRATTTSADLYAIRVSRDLRLLDWPPAHIGTFEGQLSSIARAATGQLLIAYTRLTDSGPHFTQRAYTRVIAFLKARAVRGVFGR